jgi:hypothetical protein
LLASYSLTLAISPIEAPPECVSASAAGAAEAISATAMESFLKIDDVAIPLTSRENAPQGPLAVEDTRDVRRAEGGSMVGFVARRL